MDTRKLLESFKQIEEDEYGRDQGALNEPDDYSEEQFFQDVAGWENEEHHTADQDPGSIELQGNNVIHHGPGSGDVLGKLSSKGGQMIVMHGAYGGVGDEMNDLLGAITHDQGMSGFNVFYYQPGYVGHAKTIEGACSALLIAAFS